MNSFISAVTNRTTTANGAVTHRSSLSACLDLFSMGVSSANKTALISSAMQEDLPLAIKIVAYLRDPRGGQGNRDIARAFHSLVISQLSDYPSFMSRYLQLFPHIPEIGSWRDLYELYRYPECRPTILSLAYSAISSGDRLAAKWFPRQSDIHRDLATTHFSGSLGAARRFITAATNVVETAMCRREWSTIDYKSVPSRANLIYSKAFLLHDYSRRQRFLDSVLANTATMHATTLYPHEITSKASDSSADALWASLPDYMAGSEHFNVLPIIDVSSSMEDTAYSRFSCMDIAIGLGMYFASHNRGAYKDLYCTFATRPEFRHLPSGKLLASQVQDVIRSNWSGSTNLQATFDLILATAKTCPLADIPKVIFLVSDMEFDRCGSQHTNFDTIKAKFAKANIPMPIIVFWRVNVAVAQQPVTMHTTGAVLVNGYSPALAQTILSMDLEGLKTITPMTILQQAVSNAKYDFIDHIFA